MVTETRLSQHTGRILASINNTPRIIHINRLRRTTDSLNISRKLNEINVTCTIYTGATVSLKRSDILRPESSNFVLRTVNGENALFQEKLRLH